MALCTSLIASHISRTDFNVLWATAAATTTPAILGCLFSEVTCRNFQLDTVAVLIMIWMAVQWIWLCVLVGAQLFNIARELTTNEQINAHKYDYLQQTSAVAPCTGSHNGRAGPHYHHIDRFHNPFDAGTTRNCLEFWRGEGDGRLWLAAESVTDALARMHRLSNDERV